MSWIERMAMEPPFRLVARALLPYLRPSIETRSTWELSARPHYLLGIFEAAKQAKKQGVPEISVIEFGVAGGNGLVAMQEEAASVEQATGIRIQVFGFDSGGSGLPQLIGDYRDHPDAWQAGDFAMDEPQLRRRLMPRTTLILGNVRDTVPSFFLTAQRPPIGFVSFDLDLYSSTSDALKIFTVPGSRMLWNTPLYFDDINFVFNHRWAGEFLAISEFNDANDDIKIDRWYGVRNGRPFPERGIFDKMFIAHNLKEISGARLERKQVDLRLSP